MIITSDLLCRLTSGTISFFYFHPIIYWGLASIYLIYTFDSCFKDFKISHWADFKAWQTRKKSTIKERPDDNL